MQAAEIPYRSWRDDTPERERSYSIAVRRLGLGQRAIDRVISPEDEYWRLRSWWWRTRGYAGCRAELRAEGWCPWVSCKNHLYIDILRTGSIKLNYPDLEVWELTTPCAIEIADEGGHILEEIGELMNLTRERVRQVELIALGKAGPLFKAAGAKEYVR